MEAGKCYTTFHVSEIIAICFRHEIQVKEVRDEGVFVFVERGKRKLKVGRKRLVSKLRDPAMLVFEGWDLPIKADSDTSSFRGSANINLVGDPAIVKDFVEKKNLNPAFSAKDRIMVVVDGVYSPLYPDGSTGSRGVDRAAYPIAIDPHGYERPVCFFACNGRGWEWFGFKKHPGGIWDGFVHGFEDEFGSFSVQELSELGVHGTEDPETIRGLQAPVGWAWKAASL